MFKNLINKMFSKKEEGQVFGLYLIQFKTKCAKGTFWAMKTEHSLEDARTFVAMLDHGNIEHKHIVVV